MPSADSYGSLVARTYDSVYRVLRDPSGDAAYYLDLARRTGGPVLELGCGTGRILLPIAREGIACVGVDASAAMLDAFRAKSPPPNLELVERRMEALDLGDRRFRLVTIPFRALSHLLDVKTQLAGLAAVRRHLEPGGLLAFDVFDPKLDRTALLEEPESFNATFQQEGHEIRRWESVRRDPTRQVLTVRFRFEGGPPDLSGIVELEMRWFYRYEVEHLLARAGFTDATFHGGFDGRPWAAGGETIVIARAPG